MQYAVVDTGSNTIRMSVYEYEKGVLLETFTEAVFANLAGFIKDSRLDDEGIKACCRALNHHKETAKKYGAPILVFATAAIRNAKNADEIVKSVKEKTGLDMQILSGQDEAELSFYGAREDFSKDSAVFADVGGGSSEIVAFSDKKPEILKSIPLGSLSAYKRFSSGEIPQNDEIENMKKAIKAAIDESDALKKVKADTLCLVGGGILAAKKLATAILGDEKIDKDAIDKMIFALKSCGDTEKILEALVPKRKLTIIPGLAIYSAIAECFGVNNIELSGKGIKEGFVLKYILQQI